MNAPAASIPTFTVPPGTAALEPLAVAGLSASPAVPVAVIAA
jgi:hypothetical protein